MLCRVVDLDCQQLIFGIGLEGHFIVGRIGYRYAAVYHFQNGVQNIGNSGLFQSLELFGCEFFSQIHIERPKNLRVSIC